MAPYSIVFQQFRTGCQGFWGAIPSAFLDKPSRRKTRGGGKNWCKITNLLSSKSDSHNMPKHESLPEGRLSCDDHLGLTLQHDRLAIEPFRSFHFYEVDTVVVRHQVELEADEVIVVEHLQLAAHAVEQTNRRTDPSCSGRTR